jgi:hypothetical protein
MGPRVRGDNELKNFVRFPSRILPDGQISEFHVQPLSKKYSDFPKAKSVVYPLPSRPTEGRFAIVTDAGRDAVDADALLTNGADADGEGVWS